MVTNYLFIKGGFIYNLFLWREGLTASAQGSMARQTPHHTTPRTRHPSSFVSHQDLAGFPATVLLLTG